jgi:hypothetical protein
MSRGQIQAKSRSDEHERWRRYGKFCCRAPMQATRGCPYSSLQEHSGSQWITVDVCRTTAAQSFGFHRLHGQQIGFVSNLLKRENSHPNLLLLPRLSKAKTLVDISPGSNS